MKGLILSVAIAVAGLLVSALPRPATALENWPPLLTCPDVDGDGSVSLFGDIFAVAERFGATYPDEDYLLLYDVDGGGSIDLFGDIFAMASRYGEACPLVDTQVALTTLAVEKYRDQAVAIADGYVPGTQNIAGHGVHWIKPSLMDGVLDRTQPEGLNYSLDGELIAIYYIDPLWLPGHEQPVEWLFDGDEDMWHDHPGLCQWQGPDGPMVAENVAQEDCLSRPGGIWWQSFGWMIHLWNYLPNPMGRFMMENPAAG